MDHCWETVKDSLFSVLYSKHVTAGHVCEQKSPKTWGLEWKCMYVPHGTLFWRFVGSFNGLCTI